jgi:hypothetical protein
VCGWKDRPCGCKRNGNGTKILTDGSGYCANGRKIRFSGSKSLADRTKSLGNGRKSCVAGCKSCVAGCKSLADRCIIPVAGSVIRARGRPGEVCGETQRRSDCSPDHGAMIGVFRGDVKAPSRTRERSRSAQDGISGGLWRLRASIGLDRPRAFPHSHCAHGYPC